jgi:hypothetical protein
VTPPVRPWTQILEINWRPELRVIERRTELIRVFEDSHKLSSFRVNERDAAMRFISGEQVSLAIDGVDIALRERTEDSLTALEVIFRTVRPQVSMVRAWFTHLVPVDADYDHVRLVSGAHFFPWWPGKLRDWSVLVDSAGTAAGIDYQCEVGLVASHEIPARVSRSVGRVDSAPARLTNEPDNRPLPPVALFMDSHWVRGLDRPAEPYQAVVEFIDIATTEANFLATRLHEAILATVARPTHDDTVRG